MMARHQTAPRPFFRIRISSQGQAGVENLLDLTTRGAFAATALTGAKTIKDLTRIESLVGLD
ncbi:hypothetical protein OH492_14030 [Vibrio chagasii]|nr:hypothetical protein [Vibrio chagasii]